MSYSKRAHDYPAVLTVQQLADFLNIGRNAAYEQCHRPGFPALRIGKQLRIPRDALLRWLDAQTGAGGSPLAPLSDTGD
jgi:excisionase family DNA binding protein